MTEDAEEARQEAARLELQDMLDRLQMGAAIEAAQAGRAEYPRDPFFPSAMAEARRWRRNLDGALADARDALALDPGDVRANLVLGEIRSSQGSAKETIEAWRRVLAAEPQRVEIWSRLVRLVLADQGPGAAAIALDDAGTHLPDPDVADLSAEILASAEDRGLGDLAAQIAERARQRVGHDAWLRRELKMRLALGDEAWIEAAVQRRGSAPQALWGPILAVRDLAAEPFVRLTPAGDVERVAFAPPRIWGGEDIRPTLWSAGPAPYVAEILDAHIRGRSSLIVAGGAILNDLGGDDEFGRLVDWKADPGVAAQSDNRVVLDWSDVTFGELDAGVMLSGLASNAFGHWVPDYLGRVAFLAGYPGFAGLPVIVDADMPQAHFDYLSLLIDNPLVRIGRDEGLRCGRLIIAGAPTFSPVALFPHSIPPHRLAALSLHALGFLRDRVLRRLPDRPRPPRRRVFIGRKSMRWRRLVNEAEIEAALRPLGFETFYPEAMSFADQVEMFRSAEAVVGPNGSAFLNLIFAPPGTPALLLSQAGMFNWGVFQGAMEQLGYDPLFVAGSSGRGKHSDYTVDPADVLGALAASGVR